MLLRLLHLSPSLQFLGFSMHRVPLECTITLVPQHDSEDCMEGLDIHTYGEQPGYESVYGAVMMLEV